MSRQSPDRDATGGVLVESQNPNFDPRIIFSEMEIHCANNVDPEPYFTEVLERIARYNRDERHRTRAMALLTQVA